MDISPGQSRTTPDPEQVEALIQVAMEAIQAHAHTASASEVISACLTLALRATKAALDMGANPVAIRTAIERILIECVPPTATRFH